jgi:Flp pilus assembly protein TadB
MFAFEKSSETGLENPLQQAIRELLTRVRGGMPPDRALDLIQKQIRHENFSDLITAIRFNFRHRGRLTDLLEQLEIQLHRIEEEHDRRKLSNARDVTLTMIILLAVPVLFIFRLASSESIRELFFSADLGQVALVMALAAYLIAIAAFLLIKRKITG